MARRKSKRRKPQRRGLTKARKKRTSDRAFYAEIAETFAAEIEAHGSNFNLWPNTDRWRLWAWYAHGEDPNDADAVEAAREMYCNPGGVRGEERTEPPFL